jgi:hypothetical protein
MTTPAYKETAAYKEWLATLEERFGADQISFREVGEYGWSTLAVTEDDKPAFVKSSSKLHYVDASPKFREHRLHGKLFGSFYFNEDAGKIYFEK